MICLKLFPEKKLIYLLILSWNLCGRTFPLGLSLGASISLTFDCFSIMTRVCIFFSTFRFSDFCGYQVLSPSSYRFIVTIILQGHPASSVALWGYPLCWPPSVRFRVQLTSVCLRTSPLAKRSTCCGTTVPHLPSAGISVGSDSAVTIVIIGTFSEFLGPVILSRHLLQDAHVWTP